MKRKTATKAIITVSYNEFRWEFVLIEVIKDYIFINFFKRCKFINGVSLVFLLLKKKIYILKTNYLIFLFLSICQENIENSHELSKTQLDFNKKKLKKLSRSAWPKTWS